MEQSGALSCDAVQALQAGRIKGSRRAATLGTRMTFFHHSPHPTQTNQRQERHTQHTAPGGMHKTKQMVECGRQPQMSRYVDLVRGVRCDLTISHHCCCSPVHVAGWYPARYNTIQPNVAQVDPTVDGDGH
jgi:hypothetical protein